MKKFIAFSLIISNLIALEFGQIGNTPASVGGAGVAYKKNAWAVYYNPALLGANRQASIAYSFGVGYAENKDANISKVSSMMDTIKNLNKKIEEMGFTTQAGVSNQPVVVGARNGTATQAGTWDFKDITIFDLGDVLGHLTGKTDGTGNSNDLKNYLCKKAGKESDTNCTLDTVATDLKGMTDKLTEIKGELQEAIDTTAKENPNDSTKLGILGSLVSNIDADKITGLIDGIKNGGNIDIETIIKEVGGSVKISKNTNPVVEEIFTLLDMVEKKTIGVANISSNNGIAWHIKGSKDRGAIGMGILANIYGFSSMEIDKTHSAIIIKTKNNNQDKYFKVGVSGDKIELSSSDDTNFNSSSIFSPNAKHSINANALAITEIPIAYGHTIPLPLGDLHLGATLKYIFATSMDNSMANISIPYNGDKIEPNFDFGFKNSKDNLRYTHTFGVDLGALWTLDWLSTGIVVKNLNAPTIRTANGKYRILPQVRAGVSAEIWKLTFLADIDLTPNDTLEPGKKNQMVGGGVILDLRWVDFRFGVMGDMHKNPYGPIFTAGLNIVHFLDFTVQTSTKMIDISGVSDKTGGIKRMPNYFKVSFGGRFQW